MKPYYQKDGIVLYLGDCREVLAGLEAVDHVITDPPYGEHVHAKQWISHALSAKGDKRASTKHAGLGFDCLTPEQQRQLCEWTAANCRGWMLAFTDLEGLHGWQAAIEAASLEYVRACIWDKIDSSPQFTGDRPASAAEAIVCAHRPGPKVWNGGGRRNVFRHAVNAEKGGKPHPSTKPEPLMRELVALFTDPNELVLDPFAGSGTTLRACKDLHRRCIGVEMNERYCEIAARRLDQNVLPLTTLTPGTAGPGLFENQRRDK